MSGSAAEIPLQVHPIDPFSGGAKLLANTQAEASIGQTQAQTGLLGEQARAAEIQNQIAGARLPFLMRAYGQAGGAAAGGAPPGVPGAIGASGGQDWTGPGGEIMDPTGPFSQLGAVPHGVATDLMLAPPEKWAELVPKVREQKNQYVSQAIAETLDPSTGEADPAKWNQMIANEVQSGWMTASQARNLYGHPELAQTILNSTLAVNEQPGTKAAQKGAEAAAAAPYDFKKISVPNPDGTFQERWVPVSTMVGATGGGRSQGGGGAGGGAIPPDLSQGIQRASNVLGVPSNDLTTLARIESGGDFSGNATSPTGAKGTFQFTGATASETGLANPRDNREAAMKAGLLWRENQVDLSQSLGRPPASSEIYLAHQQGAAGAAALLQAPRDALAVDVLKQAGIPPRNVLVNGGTPTMTAGQFVDKWRQAWDRASGRPEQPTAGATPAAMLAPGGGGIAAEPPQLSPQVSKLVDLDKGMIEEDAKTNASNLQAGLNANKAGVTIRELRDLTRGAPTGSWADQRMALQSAATQVGGALGERLATLISGMDKSGLTQMQQINKLAQQLVVSQEQAIGPGVRIGAMFTNFMAKASPNISMQEPAIQQILNMGLIAQQMAKDYANDSNATFSQSRDATRHSIIQGPYTPYQPLNQVEAKWTAPGSVHGPDVYAAATNLLNGMKAPDAFKGLKPPQIQEAVDIINRADPASLPTIMQRPDVVGWRKSLTAAK